MRISSIHVYKIDLPFAVEFSHSLRKRSFTKNIVVETIIHGGEIRGYGEGAPRSYVTGETQEGTVDSLGAFLSKSSFPWDLDDVSQVWDFIESLPDNKNHNSAICALESSLLDALASSMNHTILHFFPRDFFRQPVHYGAAIPIAPADRIMRLCALIKERGIYKLRLKMGKELEENAKRLEIIRKVFGDHVDLRIDVNGGWSRDLAFRHIPLIKKYGIKVVEQPLAPDDPELAGFAEEVKKYGSILMADEIACSMNDVKKIINEKNYGIINIRMSKCGGLRRSLKIVEHLRAAGLLFQIGCQLGESGILSAAGRALCLLCGDASYYDGSYDSFLLAENTTLEDVTFGYGGRAGPLDGPGLGVNVSVGQLERMMNSNRIIIENPNR